MVYCYIIHIPLCSIILYHYYMVYIYILMVYYYYGQWYIIIFNWSFFSTDPIDLFADQLRMPTWRSWGQTFVQACSRWSTTSWRPRDGDGRWVDGPTVQALVEKLGVRTQDRTIPENVSNFSTARHSYKRFEAQKLKTNVFFFGWILQKIWLFFFFFLTCCFVRN